jgi:hypothetical protein
MEERVVAAILPDDELAVSSPASAMFEWDID